MHVREGIPGSLRTSIINEAHWERMRWPCFSPLAHEWTSQKLTRSSHNCMEKSHRSSKLEAEDFRLLKAESVDLIFLCCFLLHLFLFKGFSHILPLSIIAWND